MCWASSSIILTDIDQSDNLFQIGRNNTPFRSLEGKKDVFQDFLNSLVIKTELFYSVMLNETVAFSTVI